MPEGSGLFPEGGAWLPEGSGSVPQGGGSAAGRSGCTRAGGQDAHPTLSVERTWRNICAVRNVSDFKTVTSYRLIGKDQYEQVAPGGELKHGTLGEQAYTNKANTYGLLLSIDALQLAEQKFRDQVDADGKPILIRPALLLVPTALAVTARRLFNETRVNETTDTGKAKPADNPFAGMFRPVVSPYLNAQGLSGSSAKAWYLFANPADVAAIEIAYLRGRRTPTVESGETSFNTLGMQWRGYFDFGVAMQDRRAAIKSKGDA